MPVVPATWEAEAGGSLEPGGQRVPLHSSLRDRAKLQLRKKKRERERRKKAGKEGRREGRQAGKLK